MVLFAQTFPVRKSEGRLLLLQNQALGKWRNDYFRSMSDMERVFSVGVSGGVERAVALFVASLVPGVGERHIAARDAAEAARVAEQQEREARASQAEEERHPSDAAGGAGTSETAASTDEDRASKS